MQWNTTKVCARFAISLLITASYTYADCNDSATNISENDPISLEQNVSSPNLEYRLTTIERSLEDCLNALKQNQSPNSATNPPGMPLTRNGCSLQVSADALLWQLQEDGLTYALSYLTRPYGVSNFPKGAALVKQKYNWGFRIGLDWTIPHDNWDITATWTHLISNSRNNTVTRTDLNPPNDFLFQLQGINDETAALQFFTASAYYRNHLDQIRLNIGREFFVSKWVILRPYIGSRTDWLHQRLRTSNFGNVNTADLTLSSQQINKWWGTGMEAGCSLQMGFCGGFNIYGDIASAIEYGLQKLRADAFGTNFPPNLTSYPFNGLSTSYHICRSILDFQLGLGWDYNSCHDRFHFGWNLGWESHIYFNQSRFLNFQSASSNGAASSPELAIYSEVQRGGDLTYQGWTAHVNFDF